MAWELKGARSVKNDLKIKEDFNFQQSAKDLLITSQLRTAIITSKKIKSANYNIDTHKKKFIYMVLLKTRKREQKLSMKRNKFLM